MGQVVNTDTVIVGAGPIGLELAASLKRAGVEYTQLDAGQIGHTISWWAPGTRFFSSPERIAIAGVPLVTAGQEKATREEYLRYLRGVVEEFDLRVRTFERVEDVKRDGGELVVRAKGQGGEQREYRTRRVVLAIGDMHRPRRLGVPGEDLPHVSHYLGEPHRYFRRRVVIVGGKNSAVEAAIRLYRVGARVTVSYRGERFDPERIKYWLLPEINWLIQKGMVEFWPRTAPVAIAPGLVRLRSADVGEEREVEADEVLLLTGYEQDPALFERIGVELGPPPTRAPVVNPRTMETRVPGVHIIGTAVAGTQSRFRVFIENSHVHVARVMRVITGEGVAEEPEVRAEGLLEM